MNSLDPTPLDLEAYAAAVGAGAAFVATPDTTSQLGPEAAVFLALARHLAKVTAAVDGPPIKLVDVLTEWPNGVTPAAYPRAILQSVVHAEGSWQDVPFEDPTDPTIDVLTDTDALWWCGEDTGTARVVIFATFEEHANALATAIRDSLNGNLDDICFLRLSLPQLALPPAFRNYFTADTLPRFGAFFDALTRAGDEAGEGKVWRADVQLTWACPRLASRPRIPDLQQATEVVVAPAQEP